MAHQSNLIAENIEKYLKEHENKELLRFITCGSVDDGKSTLIGRLLHDSKMIFEDQLKAIERDSKKVGTVGDKIDLALLVDGLVSEREQGITIDVAYRYFSTDKRKFIIADTPGHEQYTRNMATGASSANLAIILIDAREGVLTQTKRHSYIVNLLGIKNIIVAINKMDLVKFSKEVFEKIRDDYLKFAKELNIENLIFIPISALNGDNIVHPSLNTPWYQGDTLMEILEIIEIERDINLINFRFSVQYVNRPNLNFRGYCGVINSGVVKVGDEVTTLPSLKKSKVKSIVTFDGELKEAFAPMSITLTLEDEIDISRGDIIAHSNSLPQVSDSLNVHIVWMSEEPMIIGKSYIVKHLSSNVTASIDKIYHQIDINSLEKIEVNQLNLNEIGYCRLNLTKEIAFDNYRENRSMGSFIIIDKFTNITVGAGMIASKSYNQDSKRDNFSIFNRWNFKKQTIDRVSKIPFFQEREILYIKIGKNVGYEQDGKGEDFLRPVLVYKKFNREHFLGFPLTSKPKEGKFYFQIEHNNRVSYLILSQIKTFSARRISHSIAKIGKKRHQEVHQKFVDLVTP